MQIVHIRGFSGKFADTANEMRSVYSRQKKFCIIKYQLSSTYYAEYHSLLLIIDRFVGYETEQGYGARSTSQINVHTVKSMHFLCTLNT